jgi:chaperonin GroES
MSDNFTDNLQALEPLEDHIILRREKSTETAGGIILPDTPQGKSFAAKGRILAVGPGRILDDGSHREMPLKAGDVVFFSHYSTLDMGEEFRSLLIQLGASKEEANDILMLNLPNVILKIQDSKNGFRSKSRSYRDSGSGRK